MAIKNACPSQFTSPPLIRSLPRSLARRARRHLLCAASREHTLLSGCDGQPGDKCRVLYYSTNNKVYYSFLTIALDTLLSVQRQRIIVCVAPEAAPEALTATLTATKDDTYEQTNTRCPYGRMVGCNVCHVAQSCMRRRVLSIGSNLTLTIAVRRGCYLCPK